MYVQPPKSLTGVRSGNFIRASVPHDGAYWHEMVFWACALLMYFYRHPLFNLASSYGADAQEMSEHGHAIKDMGDCTYRSMSVSKDIVAY